MKFPVLITNFLSTFFLFIPEGKTQLLEGEMDLSASPFALCQCAISSIDDPCRMDHEKWAIIDDLSIHSFNKDLTYIFGSEYSTPRGTAGLRILSKRLVLILKGKFLILNLKNETLISKIFKPKDVIIFCSQSLHQEVQKLEINNVEEIIFLPEAINERNGPLEIHFRNVKKDLYFPRNFYDYDYKIMDDDDWTRNQTFFNETFLIGTTINIQLYEVQGVYIYSHSISAKSLLLKIDGAKFLTIEKTAVRNSDPHPLLSGLNLRKINTIKAECTWGSQLTVESCNKMFLNPDSLSDSIFSVFIANTNNLSSYEDSFLYGNQNITVILNVQLWEIIGRDDIIHPPENTSLIENKILNKNQLNTLVINNTNLNFDNLKNQQLLKFEIIISNSTFERRNNSNFSLSMIAYHFNIEESQVFPEWVHLCQIKDSIVCGNFDQFRNVCEIGFPYQFNDTIEGGIKCQPVLHQYIPDLPEIIIQIIVGGLFLLLVIMIIISIILICRYKKLSGKWSPDRRQGHLTSSRHSTPFKQHQVIVLPSRDPDYCFNTFPRHFSRSLSPLSNEIGFKYYTYHDNRAVETFDNKQNDKNKFVQSVPNVQLLHINNDYEDLSLRESNGHLKKGKSESTVDVTKM